MASIEEGLGFIPEMVNQAINNINEAYNNYAKTIGSTLNTKFIGLCAQNWFSNNAKSFFDSSVTPAVNELKSQVDNVFESVASSMNSAGNMWASQTGNSFSQVAFDQSAEAVDTSEIQTAGPGGFVGIMPNTESEAQSALNSIMQEVETYLENAAQAVSSSDVSGFSGGGGQAEALASALNTIKSNIQSTTQELSDQLYNYLSQEETASEEVAAKITQAFSGN